MSYKKNVINKFITISLSIYICTIKELCYFHKTFICVGINCQMKQQYMCGVEKHRNQTMTLNITILVLCLLDKDMCYVSNMFLNFRFVHDQHGHEQLIRIF